MNQPSCIESGSTKDQIFGTRTNEEFRLKSEFNIFIFGGNIEQQTVCNSGARIICKCDFALL